MGGEDKLSAGLGGEPVIGRALRVIADLEDLAVLVVVGPEERHEALHALVPGHLVDRGLEVRCVAGGDRRQDSVAAGIAAAPGRVRPRLSTIQAIVEAVPMVMQ